MTHNKSDIHEMDAAEIPEYVYESLARSLLPTVQKYYESDEGKQAFAEWQAAQTADNKEKT